MRSGAKLNVAPDRHAQARRVAVRSASTEPAAAPRKVADSDMINLGKTGELSGRQHCDSVAWDILLWAHCFSTVAVAFACASPSCLTLCALHVASTTWCLPAFADKRAFVAQNSSNTLLTVCADVRVPVIGLGAWAWGDRSGYWGYGQEYTQEESRRAYKVRTHGHSKGYAPVGWRGVEGLRNSVVDRFT